MFPSNYVRINFQILFGGLLDRLLWCQISNGVNKWHNGIELLGLNADRHLLNPNKTSKCDAYNTCLSHMAGSKNNAYKHFKRLQSVYY